MPAGAVADERGNHPLATRMAVIAAINQNIGTACVFGPFSILLGAVQARLGVGPQLSTLGLPAVTLALAICAPLAGAIATRGSLRLVMLSGAALSTLGYAVLAFASSLPVYLAAYGLLIGPGFAAGVVLPATLVTRWFAARRGRALGLVYAPVMVVVLPLVATRILQAYGAQATYVMLAALSAISFLAALLIVDRPPASAAPVPAGSARPADTATGGAATMTALLCSPRYWALIAPLIATNAAAVIIITHMVPMVRLWGISATSAATLISIQSLAGIAGTIMFGWLADRIGGAWALVLLAFDGAVLWALLLLEPPFAATVVIVALIGLHCAGSVPTISVALSQAFGSESFGRAYGLCNLISLPFTVLGVPAAALVVTRTGSYAGAILLVSAFLTVTGLAALVLASRGPRALPFAGRPAPLHPG